jgi:hypothetical protein
MIRDFWQWWTVETVSSAQKFLGALEYLWMLLAKGAHRIDGPIHRRRIEH